MKSLTRSAETCALMQQDNRVLDVWDIQSFDNELLIELQEHERSICDYFTTDRQMMLDRESSDRLRPMLSNPYAGAFHIFTEGVIMPLMQARALRAWHYTRLFDSEVDKLRVSGIHLLSLATTQQRIEAVVASGALAGVTATALLAASPLHDDDGPLRSGKFWMVSEPMRVSYPGVVPLLESWGGESIYFRQRSPDLQAVLKRLGRARVIEVAVPIRATRHALSAAQAVIAAFGRSLGCRPDHDGFDLWIQQSLGPDAILAIHTEGEPNFVALGQGYPINFHQNDDAYTLDSD